MKFAAMGLVMLATGWAREREAPVSDVNGPLSGDSPVMSTSAEDVAATADRGGDVGGDVGGDGAAAATGPSGPPGAPAGKDDWRVACELRTGAELIFDRG